MSIVSSHYPTSMDSQSFITHSLLAYVHTVSSQGSSQGSPAPLFTVRCATPVETPWQKGSGRGASVFFET
jgi:hypothetical protein